MRKSDDERPTDAHAAVDARDPFAPDEETVTTVNAHLAPGSDVGGYVIDGELGTGGMGVVYSATHPVIGKRAAIKVLKPDLSDNPAAVERFVMEARAVNQIGHPNIVDIFAFGTLPDGRSYYVMDLLAGESLRKRVKRGPLHVSEAVSVIDEIASALMAAHDKGIIHRDLKPDNVFMVSVPGRWPEAKILDWGLLKLTSHQSAVSSGKYRTLAGSVMGTPVYMSPEQARASDQVDFRTDIYALGVMAYELLSGTVPFKKGSSIDTLLAHQDEPVPSLAQKCPALPDELVQLIEAMLAKEPDGRPTLAAVRAVIKRLKGTKIPTMTAAGLQITPIPATPFVEPPTGSHPTIDEKPRLSSPSAASIMPLPPPPQAGNASVQRLDLPNQSMNISAQTTLAGHSMPLPQASRPSGLKMPVAGSIPPAYGAQSAQGSLPPQPRPSSQPSIQVQPSGPQVPPVSQPSIPAPTRSKRAQRTGGRRVLVILTAAIVVSTIGILIVLLT
ncbi:MAG TPA: protein kinase [Kofleriaceae bacterium]|nr:protein kinase [Kofleriaceae bacterium]